jgi:CRISPR/Cas system CSM-associated protein Csm3 (group 7 of RAMP superfamily)
MRTALIDGDSIAYILGWKFKDSEDENLMQYSVDNFVKSTLILLEASHYIGALSSKPTFRDQVYKSPSTKEHEVKINRVSHAGNLSLTRTCVRNGSS